MKDEMDKGKEYLLSRVKQGNGVANITLLRLLSIEMDIAKQDITTLRKEISELKEKLVTLSGKKRIAKKGGDNE